MAEELIGKNTGLVGREPERVIGVTFETDRQSYRQP